MLGRWRDFVVFDDELYLLSDDFTIQVFEVIFDRNGTPTPALRAVRTLRMTGVSSDHRGRRLTTSDGRLYFLVKISRFEIAAYRVNPRTGAATLDISSIPRPREWMEMFKNLLVADDQSVYERNDDGELIRRTSVEDLPLQFDTLNFFLMDKSLVANKAIVKDHDGCIIYVDSDNGGRLELYDPDLRKARDLGTLSMPDDMGYIKISLDEKRHLLYSSVETWANKTGLLSVFSVL